MSITISARKAKGRKFQQQIMKRISDLLDIPCGKDELIASREMGQQGVDIRLIGKALELFPFSCEAKNQESWSIHKFIKQAKENLIKGTDWLLFCKRNREKPIVILDAESFFRLYKKILKGSDKS